MDHIPPPGVYIKEEMALRGWTQDDLAKVLQRPLPTINRILNGKHAILPEMAIALGEAFGISAETWMLRESAYRLSLIKSDYDDVRQRAALYELAPVKEMQKRGWIRSTASPQELESELKTFFRISSLDEEPEIDVAMRAVRGDQFTASQRAWCYRVRQLAETVAASEYKEDEFDACISALRELALYPHETSKVSEVLATFGIRMVVVEPLTSSKIDGVALWLDQQSPVIGISLRFGRIDGFWFTLGHELSHIRRKDAAHIDADMMNLIEIRTTVRPEMERRADDDAASMLIPKSELESFVLRYSPLYSKEKIHGFARRLKIHEGLVVGQLQHRGEISYRANREMLPDVRDFVTSVALTDGWGNVIGPEVFR